jgi:hypothetical protein
MTARRGAAVGMMLGLLVSASCASSSAEPSSASTMTTAPASTSATTATTTAEVLMPDGPWKLVVADGSGNSYVIAVDGGVGTLDYSPVTTLESSSGTYSGGEPASCSLGPAEVRTIWSMALAVEQSTAQHVAQRRMGTIAQRREAGGGVTEVIVDGSVGESLVAWLRDRLKAETR